MPSPLQLTLLALSVVLFVAGGAASLWRIRAGTDEGPGGLRLGSKICLYLGILASAAVIILHARQRGTWSPANDNFESLLWLALLLAMFVMYTQRVRPVRGLDWFVMPIVIVMLSAAGFFGRNEYREYKPLVSGTWMWVHRVTAYGGAVAFALAAAVGAMYVVSARRLRAKLPGPHLGSLERLERVGMGSVVLGFALLSVGLITGAVRMFAAGAHAPIAKVLLASFAWLVYAVVLHAPFNPRFRGRRAAMLSIFGFLLMLAVLVAVQLLPASGSGGKG